MGHLDLCRQAQCGSCNLRMWKGEGGGADTVECLLGLLLGASASINLFNHQNNPAGALIFMDNLVRYLKVLIFIAFNDKDYL